MADKGKRVRLTTPEARLSYPALFEPVSMKLPDGTDGPPKYGAEFIIEADADVSAIKKACADILMKKFPDAATRPTVKLPIYNGDEENNRRLSEGMELRPELSGKLFIKARSSAKWPPKVVDENVQPVMDQEKLYGGCYVRGSITPFWFDVQVNRGLSFALNAIQFVRDGEPFGDPFDVNDAFGPVAPPAGGATANPGGIDAMFE